MRLFLTSIAVTLGLLGSLLTLFLGGMALCYALWGTETGLSAWFGFYLNLRQAA